MDPNAADIPPIAPARALPASIGILGAGRMGHALAASLGAAGLTVHGPAGRGEVPAGDAILLCVPDAEIEAAAAAVRGAAALVGHVSGATPLAALDAAGGAAFAMHPLQTVSVAAGTGPAAANGAAAAANGAAAAPPLFAGCGCAVAGSTPAALAAADALARALGMTPFEIADEHRAAYHAAASVASNFLVTLEAAAERIAGEAGLAPHDARALLAPLVRTTVENWAAHGPERALTGPVARGDEATIARQRAAVPDDLLPLFDALVASTRHLAGVAA